MAKTFIDTNIFLYAIDKRDLRKQQIAKSNIDRLANKGDLVLSMQVLQEFYVAAVGKLGFAQLDAKQLMQKLASNEVVIPDVLDVEAAVDNTVVCSLSFWDALILVAAAKAKCATLLTEGLQDGFVLNGVKVVNPF